VAELLQLADRLVLFATALHAAELLQVSERLLDRLEPGQLRQHRPDLRGVVASAFCGAFSFETSLPILSSALANVRNTVCTRATVFALGALCSTAP
jgi:hypothetical protein